MSNQVENRVEIELENYRLKEERLSSLLQSGPTSNIGLLKTRLKYYERIAAKYRKGTRSVDEKLTLHALRQEIRRLEKEIRPKNFIVRLLRRWLVVPIRQRIIARTDEKQSTLNSQSLHNQLQRTGFKGFSSILDKKLSENQSQFSIPVSYYINEKERLDFQLDFNRNRSGGYSFEGYKIALNNELNPTESKQQYFKADSFTTTEAYNLLSDRAVLKNGTWKQLDLNDQDAQGIYRMKEFPSEYGFDLDKILKEFPEIKQDDRLQNDLRQGDRKLVCFEKGGIERFYHVEANPQFKSINIYDENNKKVTHAKARGLETKEIKALTPEKENQAKQSKMQIVR